MITCPYCGTSYQTFQSNCGNCGGVLPVPENHGHNIPVIPPQPLAVPPPTPRQLPAGFVQQRLLSSTWGITGGVFAILGTVFAGLGLILTITLSDIFLGLAFLGLGLLMLPAGGAMLFLRYRDAQGQAELFKDGAAVLGELTRVRQNYNVRVNKRHPWIITYTFQITGMEHTAEYTTLDQSAGRLRINKPVYVIYWPSDPQRSILYFENDL